MFAVKSAVRDKTESFSAAFYIYQFNPKINSNRGRFDKPWEWRVYRAALLIAVAHTTFCSIYFTNGWLCWGRFHRKRERQRSEPRGGSITTSLESSPGKLARWKKIETVVPSFPRRLLEDFLPRYKSRLTFASVHHLKKCPNVRWSGRSLAKNLKRSFLPGLSWINMSIYRSSLILRLIGNLIHVVASYLLSHTFSEFPSIL